jgi:phosphatidylglycerol lysyltransferase
MTTAFVANAFSQAVGLALLTGSAVRLRAYARRGVDAAAVARISTFVTVTITLGLAACSAIALLASREPLRITQAALPVRVVGASLALVVIAYVAWGSLTRHDHVSGKRWPFRRPGAKVALGQLALSSLDWVVTGTVLFAVLPPAAGLHHGAMLRTYLVAQTVGMASHVPGGAGVFEAVVLTLATTGVPSQRAALITALVMFRVVYYLIPLLSALVVGGVAELLPHRRGRVRSMLGRGPAHVH